MSVEDLKIGIPENPIIQKVWRIVFTYGLSTVHGTILSAQLHSDLFVKNNEL